LRFPSCQFRAAALFGAFVIFFQFVCDLLDLHQDFPTKVTAGVHRFDRRTNLFSGVLLFFLGVIGEYVGRIYEETKARPQYIVGAPLV